LSGGSLAGGRQARQGRWRPRAAADWAAVFRRAHGPRVRRHREPGHQGSAASGGELPSSCTALYTAPMPWPTIRQTRPRRINSRRIAKARLILRIT